MSSEVQQKSSIGSTIAGYATMPAVTTAFSAASAVKTHGKKVFKSQNKEAFKKLNSQINADVFTKSEIMAKSYDSYKDIAKASAKSAKKANKLANKKHLPLIENIKNFFRTEDKKVTLEKLRKETNELATANSKKLKEIDGLLNKAGTKLTPDGAKNLEKALNLEEEIITKTTKKVAQEVAENSIKTTAKGFKSYVCKNFKNELGWKNGKLNYIMTALQFFPNVVNEVIPTFKNEGFGAGLKATGKTIVRMGADLIGYATGGAIGRAIGAVLGNFICPGVGARVGANIGDMVMTMIVGGVVTKKVDKALGVKTNSVSESNTQSTASNEEKKQLDIQSQNTAVNSNESREISQQLTPEQARAIIETQNQAKLNSIYA